MALIAEAKRTGTDALLVAKRGKVVASSPSAVIHRPIETRSITKSVVSLVFGQLIGSGAIASLDEPLAKWFPYLRRRKQEIRLRHLLLHTTGLRPRGGVHASWDADAYLRSSRLRVAPGTRQAYSDATTELLGDIAQRAAGIALDELAAASLFHPLGITSWRWQHRLAATPHAAFGLALSASALLRVGVMVAARGRWHGKQVLPSDWVNQLEQPGSVATPFYSLLWYLRGDGLVLEQSATRRRQMEAAGFLAARRLAGLDGPIENVHSYLEHAQPLLRPNEFDVLVRHVGRDGSPLTVSLRKVCALYAHGWPGQQLVIFPKDELVAVRLQAKSVAREGASREAFPHFIEMVARCRLGHV